MGGTESTTGGQRGVVYQTSPPPAPYHGPGVQYQFVNTEVNLNPEMLLSLSQTSSVRSDVESNYPLLAAQYAQGYRLLSFYRIPGQIQARFFSTTATIPFQGIFCRYPAVVQRESWQLRVVKSFVQTQDPFRVNYILSSTGMLGRSSNMSDILETIKQNTQEGERLLCVELTGQMDRMQIKFTGPRLSPKMVVDLFFEMPASGPAGERYVYHSIDVPMLMNIAPFGSPTVDSDWMGALASQLNQGWKLVEIFNDMVFLDSQTECCSATRITLNTVWFFEKPASRLNDPTPVYEGTVVDHLIFIRTSGFRGTKTDTNWESVIQEMGNSGWELACILETPQIENRGIGRVSLMCKLFFQRPIRPG